MSAGMAEASAAGIRRAVAAEHLHAAQVALDAAEGMPPDHPVATGFMARAQAHALTGLLAATLPDMTPVDVEPAMREVLTRVGSVLLSSDCREGFHQACKGSGWDDAASEATPCPCECHA